MLCEVSLILSKDRINDIFATMKDGFWSIKTAPKKTRLEYYEKVYWMKILLIFFYTNPFIVIPLMCYYEIHPEWYSVFDPYFPYGGFLVLIFLISPGIGCYLICYLHMFMTIYFSTNMNIQMTIMIVYFENMMDDDIQETDDGEEHACPIEYNQNTVKDRLLFGIKQHMVLRR